MPVGGFFADRRVSDQLAHMRGMARRKAGPSIFSAQKRMGVGKVHKWQKGGAA